jgi:hypothetical protein
MQEKPKGTTITLAAAIEPAEKSAGTKAALDKAVAELKKIDGVLAAEHTAADDDAKSLAIAVTFDPKKPFVLTVLAAAASVTVGEKSVKPGAATVKIAGTLYRRDEFWIFEEPATLRVRIAFASEELEAKILKSIAAEKAEGTIEGLVEQDEIFEPSDPKRKMVSTKVTIGAFEKSK